MPDERPKQEGKGERPKQEGKGDERPKQEGKGGPSGGAGEGSGDSTLGILRSAADRSGLLIVAIVSPIGGSGGQAGVSMTSAQKLALSELRRKAELRDREAKDEA
jgi:hypothetical protein